MYIMSTEKDPSRDLTEVEKSRLDAVQAELRSVASAASAGELTGEALAASIEAVRQIPLDPETVLNAEHIPEDAGEHRAGLERILRRIPDGWGRWISCGPGWYAIIVDLADKIAEILPEYEIHQVKEKYGALRFYWGTPYQEPPCCAEFHARDPRPAKGAILGPFAPKNRDPLVQRLLEEWLGRYDAHVASAEHKLTLEKRASSADLESRKSLAARIEALIEEAERTSARTCERCGAPGSLHENRGWLQTLCEPCASADSYIPCR